MFIILSGEGIRRLLHLISLFSDEREHYVMKDLRLSRLWLSRMPSSGMWRRVDLVWTEVSEERTASVFMNQREQIAVD
jgi:hypothetical protein